ncbi:head maturation protease, ClpP-related [Melghiribacillus thermohalophilus]|uniref:head maturation protease, ClpP-related n=1 Tax=Melghiribacillus thermohalophilus TaxID=1324956 RepID=UPI001FB27694|nr:head maturation protease, ClpP-related [Melghiribacillus thermohalophilus]
MKGTIVSNDMKWIYEWFDMEATSPRDVMEVLDEANGEEVEVEINSGGGDVFAGSEIYTALKDYQGTIVTKVVGIAASAASVIAMAGDRVLISPTAQIMIHNVWSMARGDYRAMQHEADVLKNYNVTIANAYKLKSGMDEKEILKMMDDETWLNAQQAKEKGFVDEILFDEGNQLVASASYGFVLPPEVVNKVRNYIKPQQQDPVNQNQEPDDDHKQAELYQARLNFLKLKGGVSHEVD